MRPSRVFRQLYRVFILLLSLSITIPAMLGAYSAFIILRNYEENINVDEGSIDFNFDLTPGAENVNFSLPFNITNAGYFDLENLMLEVDIAVNYSHVDWGGPGINVTRFVPVFQNSENYGTIGKGDTANFVFIGLNSTFIHENIPDPLTEIDWFYGPPAIEFIANFTISLDYTLGMHSLTIAIINYSIGELP
ncbi:MAG: hypothetical protein ACFE8N_00955 [Promethearchaeota archaeon]